jgi:hypothetical protein
MNPARTEQSPQARRSARQDETPAVHRYVIWVSRHDTAWLLLRRVESVLSTWTKRLARFRRFVIVERAAIALRFGPKLADSSPPAATKNDAGTFRPDRVYAQPNGDAMLTFLKKAPRVDDKYDDTDFGDTD